MIKNMRDARFGTGLYLGEVMRGAGRDYMTEDMLEETVANLTGQIILRFKMAVKCTAANVGGVNNFFYADFFVAGFVQQIYKGINSGQQLHRHDSLVAEGQYADTSGNRGKILYDADKSGYR